MLVSKDINHYNSTTRTIMRFMSAIIIAGVDELFAMFKSVLNPANGQLMNGVWMLFSGVGLLAVWGCI
ncbi:hypothetical protein [Marinomonas sp. MED121]|uniref:hypothetical protein n=1 Tax=Marinomonas sp. MED121 TaxID=314277 RepID=UPI001F5FBDB2|nr:hypothetical protein [Marinomonas sp. MED121]